MNPLFEFLRDGSANNKLDKHEEQSAAVKRRDGQEIECPGEDVGREKGAVPDGSGVQSIEVDEADAASAT